jgi:hypothetical protein
MTDVLWGLTALTDAIGGWAGALSAALDQRFGDLAPAVAGAAAAFVVAITLALYRRGGYRASHQILRHGVAAIVVVGLLAFAVSGAGHAALASLGLTASKPGAELQIRPSEATAPASQTTPRSGLRSRLA